MEDVILNDAQSFYVLGSAYFPITESAHLPEVVGQADETALAGMADQEDHRVEEMKGQEDQDEQHESPEDSDYDREPEGQ